MFISQSTTNLHTTLKSASSFPSTYSSFLIGSHSSIAPEHATFFPSPTQRVRRAYNRTTVTIQSMRVLLQSYKKIYVGTSASCIPNSIPYYMYSKTSRAKLQDILIALQCNTTYYLVNPDMHTRHGLLVDLARDLHRRQYKIQPVTAACMTMLVSSEENLQQTCNRTREGERRAVMCDLLLLKKRADDLLKLAHQQQEP